MRAGRRATSAAAADFACGADHEQGDEHGGQHEAPREEHRRVESDTRVDLGPAGVAHRSEGRQGNGDRYAECHAGDRVDQPLGQRQADRVTSGGAEGGQRSLGGPVDLELATHALREQHQAADRDRHPESQQEARLQADGAQRLGVAPGGRRCR